jgi:isoquinoline 1-oxidoreductase beta subunit
VESAADEGGFKMALARTRAPRGVDVDPCPPVDATDANGISRRRFMAYLIAAPTVVAGAEMVLAEGAKAGGIPTIQLIDDYDLSDLLNESVALTAALITVVVNKDNTVSFALPRAEVGQGLTTSVAMIIADEMDIGLSQVNMTLAQADAKLVWNQFTGGSNSIHSLYDPVRAASAAAKAQLMKAAADHLGTSSLTVSGGVVRAPDGRTVTYGDLADRAAVTETTRIFARAKAASAHTVVGTPQKRVDALDAVTGRKQFAMDLEVPGAMPAIICRPPTINGHAVAVNNLNAVKAMPGITDVVLVKHTNLVVGGVAVRGHTFGQCIDAVRALNVTWGAGPLDGVSASDVATKLKAAEIPLTPALGSSIQETFTFNFRPGDPLETNCAVADVSGGKATVWSALKSPILAREMIGQEIGMPVSDITVHVVQGGGSFGRHLFGDAAIEAAVISNAIGKPVKLMWHRTDNFRQGRVHPMATSTVRMTYSGNNVIAMDQRHTGVVCDFSHGLGEILTSFSAQIPGGNAYGWSQLAWLLTQRTPYNFGLVTSEIDEVYAITDFNTSSVRNIYSPDGRTAGELMVDQMANRMGKDPYQFRRSFLRDDRILAVLDKVASVGNWGRSMPAGTAQGIAIHSEYKGAAACLIEIDCTPATVNRVVANAYTGPRVTKAVYAVDVGLPINPLGLQAQMLGGIMDGIGQCLTYSLHLENGHYLEGSWDNAYYTRQWNTPFDVEVIVMPPTTGVPGGAGEFGVAASMAATACAYARATGTLPTSFPINHDKPLGFAPLPTVPPIPQSPTDGLTRAF